MNGGALAYGPRLLWSGLDLQMRPGEFIAVLGPNGTGKTSLLRVILGMIPLTRGTVTVAGRSVRRGNPTVGYIPQHRSFGADPSIRAKDVVRLGVDGHRWGPPLANRKAAATVEALLDEVGASRYASCPVRLLSGGEQQRLRVAQALANDPALLLCDEPLLTLDLNHQQAVVELLDARRRAGTAVLFVTHEINPVILHTDRVLYLVDGRFRLGTVDEVLTSDTLTELYGTRIDVIRSGGRLVVLGGHDLDSIHDGHHDHDPHGPGRHDDNGHQHHEPSYHDQHHEHGMDQLADPARHR